MTADQSGKDPFLLDELEREASTDWEEAFQAEDYLIPPAETPQETVPEDSAGEENEQSAAARGKRIGAAGRFGIFFELLGGNRFVRSLVGGLPGPLQQLPVFRSTRGRGVFVGLTIVLSCLFLLLFWSKAARQTKVVEKSPVHVAQSNPDVAQKKSSALPVATKSARPAPAVPPPAVTPKTADQSQRDAGIVLRKWRFSSFMINAAQNAAEPPSYVSVDLSLVLRLHPGEAFPADKEYAVREMIYQFFSNRPLYELRRFALARGEMKLKLEAWFRKEWPNNPIESIYFHKYHIT